MQISYSITAKRINAMGTTNNERSSRPCKIIRLASGALLGTVLIACGGSDTPVRKEHGGAPIPTPEIVFVVPTPSAETKSNEQKLTELLVAKKPDEATTVYIDACVSGPKKGYGPAFSFSSAFPLQARKDLLSAYAKLSGEENANRTKLRCIIAALARHPAPKTLQSFWREQLKSQDQQTRWWAILELSKVADEDDLELVMAQAIEVPDLGALLSKRLVQWKSPKAVPFLYDLAKNSDAFSAKRARRALDTLGYSNVLSDKGAYEKEFAWWSEMTSKYSPIDDIERPWRTDARSITKK